MIGNNHLVFLCLANERADERVDEGTDEEAVKRAGTERNKRETFERKRGCFGCRVRLPRGLIWMSEESGLTWKRADWRLIDLERGILDTGRYGSARLSSISFYGIRRCFGAKHRFRCGAVCRALHRKTWLGMIHLSGADGGLVRLGN